MAPRRSARVQAAATPAPEIAAPKPKAASQAKPKNAKKQPQKSQKAKKGLSGSKAPNSRRPLGRVDSASKLKGKIYVDEHGTVCDVMLNLVDVSKNSDKYFILQAVEQPNKALAVFTRWGRTGTAGSCATEHFDDVEAAMAAFGKKFEQKTGVAWDCTASYTPQANKYLWVQTDHAQDQVMWSENATWQYWVGDGVDGKADGAQPWHPPGRGLCTWPHDARWYDYEADASDTVEQLHHEWTFSAHLNQRVVASGAWEYLVDLSRMTQTNIKHPARKQRHVRRWTPALGDDQTPPGELVAAQEEEHQEEEDASAGTPPGAPPSVVAPATPNPKTPTKRKRGAVAAAVPATPTSKPPPAAATKAVQCSVDPQCTMTGGKVHEDFSCMLNQTNVAGGNNNNKFYRIQLLTDSAGKKFFVWTRWGRVGENGQNNLAGAYNEEAAIAAFSTKFKSKTGNAWDTRLTSFVAKVGKYDLVDIDEDADDQAAALEAAPKKAKVDSDTTYLPSTLDPATQRLISLIFNEDMFNEAMQRFDIDVKKLPLGNLSKTQVQKGYDVLTDLKAAVAANDSEEVAALTSRFYTVIPHNFGRNRPPLIDTPEKLQSKFEMCDVLADIESAQEMLQEVPTLDSKKLAPNPLDEKYATLHAQLDLVPRNNEAFKLIETYFTNTTSGWNKDRIRLENVWAVDGEKDGGAFTKESSKIGNRKLLWHGTNVAVVAAIMKGGLRIMPHSGGRVGKGIYLASEHGKSASYVRASQNTGIMFLVEAALGHVHSIQRDDSSLTSAPTGYDSILGKGRQEPDSQRNTHLKIDARDVCVPQGSPVPQDDSAGSSFHQSEYLVYKEHQQRLRYVLSFKW